MRESASDLRVLCDYLGVAAPRIIYSRVADENHVRNPRLFAFVELENRDAIHVSGAIEHVPPDVRIGLLLHELGHVYKSMDEVEADAWVLWMSPESGYHYEAEIVFKSPLHKDPVTAKNIQCVSQEFMKLIGYMEGD